MKLVKLKDQVMVETKQDAIDNINPNYLFVDIVDPLTQDDITSIENIYAFGLLTGRDYITVFTELKVLYIAKGGFSGLTDIEKTISAKSALCTEAEALSTGVTEVQFDSYIDNLADKVKEARNIRVELARKDFSRELKKGTMGYPESNLLLADTRELFNDYVTGNNPAFSKFITDTGDYVTTGISSKSYFTQARKDNLIKRIVNGIKD